MSRVFEKLYRFILLTALVSAGVFIERMGVIDYLADPYEFAYTLHLVGQHVTMVGVSILLAGVTGLAVGIIFTRPRLKRFSGVVMYLVGLGQTIPSLAVIAIAMSFMGVGFKPAVFALYVYSVLPIARNTLAGINSVPSWMIEAARGMGMTNSRILFQVELPNATPVIITGVRISLVINIGTTALAFLIGAGGLGEHIFTGIDLMRPEKLLAGAIPTTLLALSADYLIEIFGILLIPRGIRAEGKI